MTCNERGLSNENEQDGRKEGDGDRWQVFVYNLAAAFCLAYERNKAISILDFGLSGLACALLSGPSAFRFVDLFCLDRGTNKQANEWLNENNWLDLRILLHVNL